MTASVDRWLQTFMCQKYVDVFESWGYKTLQSIPSDYLARYYRWVDIGRSIINHSKVCRLEVDHLRAMGVLPEDCDKIMENVTILRQSLSAQCQSPPARFPDPMANPASSALMSMSRSASQRGRSLSHMHKTPMETVVQPPADQFPPPNVPGYPKMPPGVNYEEFRPRFSGPDPSRFPYPQQPPVGWDHGQMVGYAGPPHMRFMGGGGGPPPAHPPGGGKVWPRMPRAAGGMVGPPMYGPGMPPGPPQGIYRGYRLPRDPQQVADDIVSMTSQRYSQLRQNTPSSGSQTPKSTDPPAMLQQTTPPTTSQPGLQFQSPPNGPVQTPSQPPSNMRRYRLGSPQNSSAHRNPSPAAAGNPVFMGPCMPGGPGPHMIPGEVSPGVGFPPGPYGQRGSEGASPMSPHSMTSPGSVYSGNSSMYNHGPPHPSYRPPPGASPVSGGRGGMMSPPMLGALTPTSRPTAAMMQQEFTPHIPSISEENEMLSTSDSPILSKASASSPSLSSCSFSASSSTVHPFVSTMTTSHVAAVIAPAEFVASRKGKAAPNNNRNQVPGRGDPLQSLHKLAMFTNSQVVDPKSVVHDACFSGGIGGAPMEEGQERFNNEANLSKNSDVGTDRMNDPSQQQSLDGIQSFSSQQLNHLTDTANRQANSEVVDFNSKLMASPKNGENPCCLASSNPKDSVGSKGEEVDEGHLDSADVDVKMDLDLLLPDDLPAFSNSLEQNLGKRDGELDLWGSDKMDDKWDSLFDIPDLYTSNLVDNPEKEEANQKELDSKPRKKHDSETEMSPSKKDSVKNIPQENPLISDLLSDSGDQESTRSRSCSPQKRPPKEKKKATKTKAKKAKMRSDEEASGGTDVPIPVQSGPPPAMRPPPEYPYGGGNNPYIPTYGGYYHAQQPPIGHPQYPQAGPTPHNMANSQQTCDSPAMYGFNPPPHGPHQAFAHGSSSTVVKPECPPSSNNVSDASPASTDMSPASSITATSPLSQQARSALEARKRRRVRNFVTPKLNLSKSDSLGSPSGNSSLDSQYLDMHSKPTDLNNKDLCLKARDSSNPLRRQSRDLECFPQQNMEKACGENGELRNASGNNNLQSKSSPQQAGTRGSRAENNNSIAMYSGINQMNPNALGSRVDDCHQDKQLDQDTSVERSPFLCWGGSKKEPPDKDYNKVQGDNRFPDSYSSTRVDDKHSSKSSQFRTGNKMVSARGNHVFSSERSNKNVTQSNLQNSSYSTFRSSNHQRESILMASSQQPGNSFFSERIVSETDNMRNNESLTSGCSVISYPLVTCPSVHKVLPTVAVTKSRLPFPLGVISLSHDNSDVATLSVVPDVNGNLTVLKDAPNVENECDDATYLSSEVHSECVSDIVESSTTYRNRAADDDLVVSTVSVNKNLFRARTCSTSKGLQFVSDSLQDYLATRQFLRLQSLLKSRQVVKENRAYPCERSCSRVQDPNGNFCSNNRNVNKLNHHSVMENLMNCMKCFSKVVEDCSTCETQKTVGERNMPEEGLKIGKWRMCQAGCDSDHLDGDNLFLQKTLIRNGSRLTDWELNQLNDCLSEFKFQNSNDNCLSYTEKKGMLQPGYFSLKDLYRDFSFINAHLNITAMPVVETDNMPSLVQATGDLNTESVCTEKEKLNSRENASKDSSLSDDTSTTNGRVHTSTIDKVLNTLNSVSSSPTKSVKTPTSPSVDNGLPRRQSMRNRQSRAKQGENGIDSGDPNERSNHSTPVKIGDDGRTVDTIEMSGEGDLITIMINDSSNSMPESENSVEPVESKDDREFTESPHFSMEKIREMSKQADIAIEIPLEIISIVKNDNLGSPTAVDIKTFNASLGQSEASVFDEDQKLCSVKTEGDSFVEGHSNHMEETVEVEPLEEITKLKEEPVETTPTTESPKAKVKKKIQKRKRKSEPWEDETNDEESFKKLNLGRTFDLFKTGKIKKPKLEKPVKGKNAQKEKTPKVEKKKGESSKGQSVGPIVRVKGPKDLPIKCQVINIADQDFDGKGRSGKESSSVPQVSYELSDSVPFVCSICGHTSSHEGLGDLFGPYFPKDNISLQQKRKKDKSPKKLQTMASPKLSQGKKKDKDKSPERPKRNKKKSLDSMEWECEVQKLGKKKGNSETPKGETKDRKTPASPKKGKSTPKSAIKKDKSTPTSAKKKNKATPTSAKKKKKNRADCPVIDLTEDEPSEKSHKKTSAKSPKVPSTKVKKSTCSTTPKNATLQGKKGQQLSSKKTPVQQGNKLPVLKSVTKTSAQKKKTLSTDTQKTVGSPVMNEAGAPKEMWFHEDCLIWTSGVYIVGSHIHGIEDAVTHYRNTSCNRCKKSGATLGCFNKGCGQTFHFLCAKEAGCYFDEETFSVYCSKHKEKKMKSAVTS